MRQTSERKYATQGSLPPSHNKRRNGWRFLVRGRSKAPSSTRMDDRMDVEELMDGRSDVKPKRIRLSYRAIAARPCRRAPDPTCG